jgi:hypothetical protein
MNVKLHTPTTLKAGSGMSSVKQFFLSLIATSVSIILTFGTAAIIDHNKKESAKKEMVKMVISDFDKTINILMKTDTAFREISRMQLEVANHPERFDSLRFIVPITMSRIDIEYPETTEKIFTSSIETFSTIGNANFVNEVSSFYIYRNHYKNDVMDHLKKELEEKEAIATLKGLLSVNFSEYVYENWAMLKSLKMIRDKCMQMMNVTEQDMQAFSKQQQIDEEIGSEDSDTLQRLYEEWLKSIDVIEQANAKLAD